MAIVIISGAVAFAVAYKFYGRHLVALFDLSADTETPAHAIGDGRDYHPARASMLFGHHRTRARR